MFEFLARDVLGGGVELGQLKMSRSDLVRHGWSISGNGSVLYNPVCSYRAATMSAILSTSRRVSSSLLFRNLSTYRIYVRFTISPPPLAPSPSERPKHQFRPPFNVYIYRAKHPLPRHPGRSVISLGKRVQRILAALGLRHRIQTAYPAQHMRPLARYSAWKDSSSWKSCLYGRRGRRDKIESGAQGSAWVCHG